MTVSEILAIKRPEKLFAGDFSDVKKKYHDLARQWHPDVNKDKDAVHVFQKISALYESAVEKVRLGIWEGTGFVQFDCENGLTKVYVPYRSSRPFELGHYYVSDNHVTYVLNNDHFGLFCNGVEKIKSFGFASERMEKDIKRSLPNGTGEFRLKDGRTGLTVPKSPDVLSLRDVLEHYDGRMNPKHVAWIGSTLYNLCCYLSYSRISHNEISLDSYFINPSDHSGYLLGGWWYAVKTGAPLKTVPKRTFNYLPWEVRNKKIARTLTDRELVRALCRELLGDINGIKISEDTPKPMIDWVRGVSKDDSISEYRKWGEMLVNSFGERRFTKMELTSNELYK